MPIANLPNKLSVYSAPSTSWNKSPFGTIPWCNTTQPTGTSRPYWKIITENQHTFNGTEEKTDSLKLKLSSLKNHTFAFDLTQIQVYHPLDQRQGVIPLNPLEPVEKDVWESSTK
jgi:hypothetical protein